MEPHRIVGAMFMAVVSLSVSEARAEKTVTQLITTYDAASLADRYAIETALSQTENGMSWANAILISGRNEVPLYCSPKQIALTGSQIIDILKREAAGNPTLGQITFKEAPFGMGIIWALADVFPCPKKSR